MMRGKAALLAKITSRFPQFANSVSTTKELAGSSPPSVFIGRFGYPKVFVGPLIPPVHGDTGIYDSPETWIHSPYDSEDILAYRMQLVRGKQLVGIKDQGKIVEMAREIALSSRSPDIEAQFLQAPRGSFIHEELQAFGPSAQLESFSINPVPWENKLEKAFYDTDLSARNAMLELYEKGEPFTAIQRALSVGALGLEKNRKLVPTRWSITAVDSNLSERLLEEVKQFPVIDACRVYESGEFRNKHIILLYPSLWQYEWIEAFFPSTPGDQLAIFSDGEGFAKKREYSSVGGCYYSARLAAAELLHRETKQAGVLILREAYSDYIPLGVWNVRENIRKAMQQEPKAFNSFSEAANYAFSRLKLPEKDWRANSKTLQEKTTQTQLAAFL